MFHGVIGVLGVVGSSGTASAHTVAERLLVDISVCFPQDATNISGTFNGKIQTLQSNDTDVVTCSCQTEIDSFQCVPSTDIRRHYIHFTVASSNRAEILGLLQYSIFNKTFISTIKRGEILRRFHNDKKSSHRKQLRRRIRETSREYRSTHLDITHISACGVTRSCFRYGDSADCGHMTCKFFVSIASDVTNENFDVELSGITDGWIGIGFSSDKIMGGEDDIISCQKFHKDRVEIMSYVSRTRHSRPERLEPHYLNLTSSKSSDAYIYCRFVLPFSRPHVNGRRYLDPTNDWYQMYARGPLTMDGMLGKHSEQPLVSAHKVSFLKSMNIYTSGGSSFLRHVSYFAQILLLSLLWCL
ncbi:hypothetical protein FSP39_014577 [Pinctada imbricata]|uniref:DOMON domain-containing protein n=1 Tax=Pinctada imbricata TaxID=66713 RepID=A0AA88YRB6_PINIB|nr:hypothetical protein FSP39_014577 [Pinctada imbricata]